MTDTQIFEEARHRSIMGIKLQHLIASARECQEVPGFVAEVGVYRGGSGLALSRVFARKACYLIDTFTGIPEDDSASNGHKCGDFSDTDFDAVSEFLRRAGANNAIVLQADIRDWKAVSRLAPLRYAFVHLDADIEQSTTSAVNFFVPRLSPGGGIFFDDYGHDKCASVKPIVDGLASNGAFKLITGRGTAFLKLV